MPPAALQRPYQHQQATFSLSGSPSARFHVPATPGEVVIRSSAPDDDRGSGKVDWSFEPGDTKPGGLAS